MERMWAAKFALFKLTSGSPVPFAHPPRLQAALSRYDLCELAGRRRTGGGLSGGEIAYIRRREGNAHRGAVGRLRARNAAPRRAAPSQLKWTVAAARLAPIGRPIASGRRSSVLAQRRPACGIRHDGAWRAAGRRRRPSLRVSGRGELIMFRTSRRRRLAAQNRRSGALWSW